ncbi:mitochondrial import inner membrane translocase subunit tim-17 [Blastomyces dermatitidis ATCC 18188]|uniref:Mitochondrial import inner membrane translocase subunit tim-17 n=1 Tax=Ajellomyces dermatitidis (strain ATCC 18188 / CBS 674.68) TaxID=653446 RepID=F2T293_AJEDA|nr:mitochondrial import inner membrane translocase subunit tim-17 [Blastomyces dermatitidis ATCC 18188]
MDHTRDPCPWVALSDFGGAFSMGAIGGAVWHGVKGFRNSPYGERRIGALTAIKARAPVVGGNFGVWGGMFSTFDCAVKGIRKKEDPYNAIIAGFFYGRCTRYSRWYESCQKLSHHVRLLLGCD